MSFSSYKTKANRGFTLIELLVSISIMLVITATVLLNQSNYTDEVALKNLANDISLSLRETQIYGTGVRELSQGSGDFSAAYGLMFQDFGGLETQYYTFADRGDTKNGIYDGPATCPTDAASECLKVTSLTNGNIIQDVCLVFNPTFNLAPACQFTGRVDITFARPETKANMVFWNPNASGIVTASSFLFVGVRIKVLSPAGATRSIDIFTTGQISVH